MSSDAIGQRVNTGSANSAYLPPKCSFGLSVSDIAQKVGYASVYRFPRAFKNVMGVSPLQYRKTAGIM